MPRFDIVVPPFPWTEAPTPPPDGDSRPFVYLHPGQMHITTGHRAIKTLLGSCVAVCLWDETGLVGGMVHFLLPRAFEATGEVGRYGDLAIAALIRGVRALGAGPQALRAKVFGGGCVLPVLANHAGNLGDHNVRVAFEALAAERIPIVGSDVGGTTGRRVLFHVDDGSAWVWRLDDP